MPNGEKKEFRELAVGECFDPGFAHIIEKSYDKFPNRPFGTYMKTGENKAVWLRIGQEREFSPNKLVRIVKVKIIKE